MKKSNNNYNNDNPIHKSDKFYSPVDVSSMPISSVPDTCFEMVNAYGTYEIQPTANTPNDFPAISQGLPSDSVADIPKDFDEGIMPKLNVNGEEESTKSPHRVVQGYCENEEKEEAQD